MWRDEIVEEIRQVRQEQAARFGYNIAAIVADARKRQQEGNRCVVSRPARRTGRADTPKS